MYVNKLYSCKLAHKQTATRFIQGEKSDLYYYLKSDLIYIFLSIMQSNIRPTLYALQVFVTPSCQNV